MSKKKIFVVEDESIVSLEIQNRLKVLGYEVAGHAASGDEAITKITQVKPDLVLMDIRIKGDIDGIETASRIKKILDIPIIFLTAYADETTLQRAKITDPFGYIIKPFEERELSINIEIALYKDHTQKLLREKDKWLSTILKSIGDGVIATDQYGIIQFINPIAERLTGYSKAEAVGKNLSDIYKVRSEETKEIVLNPYQEVLAKGEIIGLANHTELIQKSGVTLPIMDSGSPIKDPTGKIIGVVVVFQDMSYYKSVEDQIKLHTTALNAAHNSIVITDKEGLPVWVNKSMERLTGYKSSDIYNQNLRILQSGHHDKAFYENLWNTISGGKVWRGEIINKKKNGEFYYEEMTITPMKNYNGEIVNYIAIKDDISDRKKNEIELKKAKEDAEKSDQLKSEFLAQMSHEIRTPINIISNFMQIYEDELTDKLTPELKGSIASVKSQSLRIISTIDSILNMAQLNTGTFVPKLQNVNLFEDVIKPSMEQWTILAKEKDLEFKIIGGFENLYLEGDAYCLNKALDHIVDNAIKYTNEGEVEIHCDTEDETIVLSVYDTGIGISADYLPHIFEPFTQEQQGYNRQYEGNGLGMALVKQYCHVNNASIKIDSQKGKGTIVKISIPLLKKGG